MIANVIENFDVKLIRLSEDKLEKTRLWRNDPKISQFMIYRGEITPEMQKKWFDKVNNDFNLYYIVSFRGEEIGLINVKDIDENYTSGEVGCYIYEDKYLNSDICYRALICLFEYIFSNTDLKALTSEVLSSNRRALRFTEFLGLKKVDMDGDVVHFYLSKEDYFVNKNRLRFLKKEDNKKLIK